MHMSESENVTLNHKVAPLIFHDGKISIKAWRNWPILLAKHRLKSGVIFLSTANDSETNNSVCQAMLASLANALKRRRESEIFDCAFRNILSSCAIRMLCQIINDVC